MRRWLPVLLLLLASVALLAQSATYPAGVVSFTTKTAGQTIQSAHINALQLEIAAVENGLLNGLAHVVRPLTDATYDLGTASFRWRDGFYSRNVTVNGTLTAPALVGGWTVVTSTSTGTLNDFAPGLVGNTVLRMNNATLATITGFAGGADGQLVDIEAVGAGQVDLAPQNTGSTTAGDRLINIAGMGVTAANTSLAAGGTGGAALYRYDGSASRWRLIAHEQGAWITPTSPTWSPNVTGTFTPTSTQNLRYLLRGRELLVSLTVTGTNSSASNTAIALNNTGWGGFTSTGTMTASILITDTGAGNQQSGFVQVAAAGTALSMAKYNSAAYTTGASAVSFFTTAAFEVQD